MKHPSLNSRTSRFCRSVSQLYLLGIILFSLFLLSSFTTATAQADTFTVASDKIIMKGAIDPTFIDTAITGLPNADLVYTVEKQMELRVMDESGKNVRNLTEKDNNILGINFPLDEDGQPPAIHWKGDPEHIPGTSIILFKAENEHSSHIFNRNNPSIGWDCDIWALDLKKKTYTRLTNFDKGNGTHYSTLSRDGQWYVYPLRLEIGNPAKNFGVVRMVFNQITFDDSGTIELTYKFALDPDGSMYYRPASIFHHKDGSYTLDYVAGSSKILDPYRVTWDPTQEDSTIRYQQLLTTPTLHEDFITFTPDKAQMLLIQGPLKGEKYQTDMYITDLTLANKQRLTTYNLDRQEKQVASDFGAQLSHFSWHKTGTVLFYSLWTNEEQGKACRDAGIHRLELKKKPPKKK